MSAKSRFQPIRGRDENLDRVQDRIKAAFDELAGEVLTEAEISALVGTTLQFSGGGAPTDAEYVLGTAHPDLPEGRIPTNTATVSWDLTVPNQIKANATGAGLPDGDYGDVIVSGGGTVMTVDTLPESRISGLVGDLSSKLPDTAGIGLVARVAPGPVTVARTLLSTSGELAIANPDGGVGNPDFSVAAIAESKVTGLTTDLAAIDTAAAATVQDLLDLERRLSALIVDQVEKFQEIPTGLTEDDYDRAVNLLS